VCGRFYGAEAPCRPGGSRSSIWNWTRCPIGCGVQNTNHVLTRTAIIEHVWDIHYDSMTNIVDVHIRALRSKIDRTFPPPLIHTVRGVGYVLKTKED